MDRRKRLAKHHLTFEQIESVARLFSVLSEPSRLVILQALRREPLTVSELIEECEMKQANVSKHLGVLYDHRLVKRAKEGNSVRYEIADPMIFSLCELVCGKVARDAATAASLFKKKG